MLAGLTAWCQAPGTAPVKISTETQMLHGRKYYVHIVEKGQTVYSISKAYKVESYDAVTHVDIHFLHPGDTVWLPARGQFPANIEVSSPSTPTTKGVQSTQNTQSTQSTEEPACGEKDRQGDTHGGDDAVAPGSDGGYLDDEVRC